MRSMRASGSLVLLIIVFGSSACRCDRSQDSEAPASAEHRGTKTKTILRPAPADAGSLHLESDGGDDETTSDPVVVVKPLDFAPAKGSKYKPMKLEPDGTMIRPDKTIGRIDHNRLFDGNGSQIATFERGGGIGIAGSDIKFRFNDANELEGPLGLRISLADDGIPTVVAKANAAPDRLTGKFVDFDPSARRAALVMLAMHDLKEAAKAANPDATNDPKVARKLEKKEGKKLEKERRKENKERKLQERNKPG
jgi:hypothetical protein